MVCQHHNENFCTFVGHFKRSDDASDNCRKYFLFREQSEGLARSTRKDVANLNIASVANLNLNPTIDLFLSLNAHEVAHPN